MREMALATNLRWARMNEKPSNWREVVSISTGPKKTNRFRNQAFEFPQRACLESKQNLVDEL